jgi:hypothetical protein
MRNGHTPNNYTDLTDEKNSAIAFASIIVHGTQKKFLFVFNVVISIFVNVSTAP